MQPVATGIREASIWINRAAENCVMARLAIEDAMALLLPTIGETAEAWNTPQAQAYIRLEEAKCLLGTS